jgi:hypothetical protein
MKSILRLAVLALAGTAALALAGNALATQKLSVRQTTTSLTIKLSQAGPSPGPADPQPAKIQIYVPTGYTINASQAPGTKIGTTTGTVFARDQNIPLPLSGDVVAVPPTTNAPGCDPVAHLAVWNLSLSVAGQTINLPVHVDQTAGPEAALGSYKLVVCLAPSDVPQGTPGRSPFGAQLLDATFTVENVFTVPAGQAIWKAITTPYNAGNGVPNVAGTVETRSYVAAGAITLVTRLVKAKRTISFSGRVTQAGAGVAGAQVTLVIDGKGQFRARTNASGVYRIPPAGQALRRKGRIGTHTFQTRVTVAERDITSTGCATPSLPGVNCVSATSAPFSAVSRKIRIRI